MSHDLVRVSLFGNDDPAWLEQIRLTWMSAIEADGFDVRGYQTDDDLAAILVRDRPQVVVTLGDPQDYPTLLAAPLLIRRRWINIGDPDTPPDQIATRIIGAYVGNATKARFPTEPLVSVFTPTYLTGDKIDRPWRSLLAQTYPNWEWVIYDDSPDDGETFARMSALAAADHRVSVFRADRACGNIGEVKRRACGLAKGEILVELDHDDELTPNALRDLVAARNRFPDAGFFYSDCAEIFENGANASYGSNWGMGYGSYREETHGGRNLLVTNYPDINALTIRHIVGVPNHYRAWTREAYFAAGGHNPEVHVCDDYELLIRTFLTTRMVHIRRLGYIQYHNTETTGNTHRKRIKEIQRLVRFFRDAYADRIHDRLVELGADDFIWREGGHLVWDAPKPDPTPIANYLFD
jgi:glycosyltransferase involved in cell wall biosynthesis